MSEKYEKFLFWLHFLSIFVVVPGLCLYFKIPDEIMGLIFGIVYGFTVGLILDEGSGSVLLILGMTLFGAFCGIIIYFNIVLGMV